MPIANWETILSKVVAGVIILPLCAFACIVVTEFIFLIIVTIAAAVMGLGAIGHLWEPMILITSWLHILGALFLQALWLFPIFGWCMFCSAYAKKSPFLTAVIPFLLAIIIEALFIHHSYISSYVASRFEMAFATWSNLLINIGSQHLAHNTMQGGFLNHLLFSGQYDFTSIYWSLIIGAALIAAAIYLRYANFRSDG